MSSNALTLGGAVVIIAILLVVLYIITSKHEVEPIRREGFFNAAGGAYVDDNTNTIKGNMILTDQMVFGKDANELLDDVRKDHYYAEEGTLGATKNSSGFDRLLSNQLAIQNINNRNNGNVMSQSDMREINKKMISSANNSNFNLFDRSGSKNIRFSVEPSGTRAVIDGDFLGDRDKNHDVTSVRRLIPVKGFNMDIERIPQQMILQKRALGTNKDNRRKTRSGEAALKDSGVIDILGDESSGKTEKEVKENFQRHGGLVVGNYNM